MKNVQKEKLLKRLAGAGVMASALFLSSLSVLAYSPKSVIYGDNIADEIIVYETNAVPWGKALTDFPVSESSEWVLLNEDGEIIEILGDIENQAEVHVYCNHNYKAVEVAKHFKYSDGGCRVEYYDGQQCSDCGNIKVGDLTSTIIYVKCPH